MNDDDPGIYAHNRVAEWVQSAATFLFGVHVLVYPASLEASRFAPLLNMISLHGMITAFITIGLASMVTLYLNGRLGQYGPALRGACAALRMVIMIQLTMVLFVSHSPGMMFYLAWACGEARTIWRAKRDLNGLRFYQ